MSPKESEVRAFRSLFGTSGGPFSSVGVDAAFPGKLSLRKESFGSRFWLSLPENPGVFNTKFFLSTKLRSELIRRDKLFELVSSSRALSAGIRMRGVPLEKECRVSSSVRWFSLS